MPNPSPTTRLTDAVDRFVQLWGTMASAWGINRTMAQLHALLYATERPLDTDAIMARLSISRGNANVNLRQLVAWGLVGRVQMHGSRKDYFVAEQDVWALTATIIREREKRELRPVVVELDAVRARLDAPGADASPEEVRLRTRLDDLVAFVRLFAQASEALLPLLDARNVDLIGHLVGFARQMTPTATADDGRPVTDDGA